MKRMSISKVKNESTSELVAGLIETVPEVKIVSKLDEALKARGLTQAKLSTLTGLRPGTISELVNGSRLSVAKTHVVSVMIALRRNQQTPKRLGSRGLFLLNWNLLLRTFCHIDFR